MYRGHLNFIFWIKERLYLNQLSLWPVLKRTGKLEICVFMFLRLPVITISCKILVFFWTKSKLVKFVYSSLDHYASDREKFKILLGFFSINKHYIKVGNYSDNRKCLSTLKYSSLELSSYMFGRLNIVPYLFCSNTSSSRNWYFEITWLDINCQYYIFYCLHSSLVFLGLGSIQSLLNIFKICNILIFM